MPIDALTEARDLLAHVTSWHMAPARWSRVETLLEAMAVALAHNDVPRFGAATVDLAFAGPVRITRIGATPAEPSPPRVRERVNRLILALESAGTRSGPVAGHPTPEERDGDRVRRD
jgi:hypothetical protein